MADKMMRVSGRSESGVAKALKTDWQGSMETHTTIKPKDIVGEVIEPYPEGYLGITSVLGLEIDWNAVTINGELLGQDMKLKDGKIYTSHYNGYVCVTNEDGRTIDKYQTLPNGETLGGVDVYDNGNIVVG